MNLDKIPKSGTTLVRKRFWDKARDTILSLQKTQGRNVSVSEHKGMGTIVSVIRERGGSGSGPFSCSSATVTAAITFTFTGGGTCHGGFCGASCSETFGSAQLPVDNRWTWLQATCGGQEVQISVVLYCQVEDDPESEFFPFKGYYLIFQYCPFMDEEVEFIGLDIPGTFSFSYTDGTCVRQWDVTLTT